MVGKKRAEAYVGLKVAARRALQHDSQLSFEQTHTLAVDKSQSRRWEDGHEDTWELEDHVPAEMVQAFEEQQRQRALGSSNANGAGSHSAEVPHAPGHSANGSGGTGAEAGIAGVEGAATGAKEAAAALV